MWNLVGGGIGVKLSYPRPYLVPSSRPRGHTAVSGAVLCLMLIVVEHLDCRELCREEINQTSNNISLCLGNMSSSNYI